MTIIAELPQAKQESGGYSTDPSCPNILIQKSFDPIGYRTYSVRSNIPAFDQ